MKKRTAIFFIFGIAIAMSAILLLLFANNKNSVFWVSFAFLELSFAVAAVITLLLAGDSKFSFPFELSLITFSYLYIAIVVAIDLLFGWIFKVYLIIYICIHLAVLSAFLIIGILMFLSKRSIAKQNETAYAS
jgi:CDP-diglyceride synthetase